jgi:hypothetical protein
MSATGYERSYLRQWDVSGCVFSNPFTAHSFSWRHVLSFSPVDLVDAGSGPSGVAWRSEPLTKHLAFRR